MVGDLRRRATRVVAGLVAAASLAGCGVPIPPDLPDTTPPRGGASDGGAVDRLVPIDVRSAELIDALVVLSDRITQARDLLLGDATTDATTDADAAGAVGVLLGAPGGGSAPAVADPGG